MTMVAVEAILDPEAQTSPGDDPELRDLRTERAQLRARVTERSDSGIFDSLELNLNQLREFYVLSRSQARSSFRLGLTSAFTGLVALVVASGFLVQRSDGTGNTTAVVTAVGGALGQFVAVSCFYMYKKALEQVNRSFTQLSRVQQVMLAVSLAVQIEDVALRDQSRREAITALLETGYLTAGALVNEG
jgi:hypothetical protein